MKKVKLLIVAILAVVASSYAQRADYFFSVQVNGNIETATERITTILKAEGFSVITEIDMDKTLREKLNVDIKPYRILGVCNAEYAHQAINIEENIGVFLPCKIVLKQVEENRVEVVSVNPGSLIKMTGNEELTGIAEKITEKLNRILESL